MEKLILEMLYLFLVYSFLGWVLEVIYHVIEEGKFINRGFLIGPYCPIYGFGMFLILYLLTPYLDSPLLLFLTSILIATIIELIGGFLLEYFFQKKWWDYTGMVLNYKGYICLKFSILWGLGALISIKFLHPMVMTIYKITPKLFIILFIIIFSLMMIIDFVITLIDIIGIDEKLKELDEIEKNIQKVSDNMGEKITDRVLKYQEKKKELIDKFNKRYGRILNAFPSMKSKKYSKIFEKIKKRKKK